MASNFPADNDEFEVPSDPQGTPLSEGHTDSHRELGDAIVALQENVAILDHDHSGGGGPRATQRLKQANTHEEADTDSSVSAIHHTLGSGPLQAAPGNHTHSLDEISGLPVYRGDTFPSNPTPGMTFYNTSNHQIWVYGRIPPSTQTKWRLAPHGVVPYLKMRQGRGQTLPRGSGGSLIEWRTAIEHHYGGMFNSAEPTNLRAPVEGMYRIDYSIGINRNILANATGVGIRVDGAFPSDGPADRWQYTRGQIFGIIQNIDGWAEVRLMEGQRVSIWLGHNSLFHESSHVGTPQESRVVMRYVGY